MALAPRLEVRQSQSLTLTPQLMQSIRLLQFGHQEISAFVEAELERNPLLERDERSELEPVSTPEPVPEANAFHDSVEHSATIGSANAIAETLDTDVSNVFPEQVGQDSISQSTSTPREARDFIGVGEAPDLDSYVAAKTSLSEHLREQVAPLLKMPADRMIAQNLIENLNEGGYLSVDCAAVAEQLGTEEADVLAVLHTVQGCDPVGIFARDVRECLAIQLRERDRLDPMMERLLDNLDMVAAHDIAALCRIVGTDREDVMDMLGEIRTLEPRPASRFGGAPVESVVPDVFVSEGNNGTWSVELNTEILPRVLVNRTYFASVSKKTRDTAEKSFLVDCMQTANWLTKSLDQRAQTILKVATEIVRQQDAFLVHGVAHLKPMTLKVVAEAIEMHESTVSRVTSNKYIATSRGLFEMKYFFTTALGSSSGGAEHSAEAVRHRIKQLVDAETATAILSDDFIAASLRRDQGIEVARRTVAKYRESMNIPSSVVRRRQKKFISTGN